MEPYTIQFELGEARRIPRHTRDTLDLFFLLKGQVLLDFDGEHYEMGENDIVVCNPGQVRGFEGFSHNIMFHLSLDEQFISQETGLSHVHLLCNSCSEERVENTLEYEQIRRLIRKLLSVHYQDGEFRRLESKSVLLQLLYSLYTQFHGAVQRSDQVNTDPRIREIIDRIHRHYREELSLREMAEELHTSLHYLSRLFKKETGKSFTSYLNQVRLDSAVKDLLYSNDSVLKIALNNGFSSTAIFNRLILDSYGQSPAKFRSERKISGSVPSGNLLKSSPEISSGLIKYLRRFEIRYTAKAQESLSLQISVDRPAHITSLYRHEQIIRVGRVIQLLKTDIRQELETLIQELRPTYVHSSCVFDDGIYPYAFEGYAPYEYFQVFDFLHKLTLQPFLQLCLPDAARTEDELKQLTQRLDRFLSTMYSRYTPEQLQGWRFEVFYPRSWEQGDIAFFYNGLTRTIRKWLPEAGISLPFYCGTEHTPQQAEVFCKLLARLSGLPDSVTIYVDSPRNREFDQSEDYEQFRHIISRQVSKLTCKLEEQGYPGFPVEVMGWNTLSGFTTAESNIFYRSAIFLDEMLHLSDQTRGIAFWLNTYIQESATGHASFDAVSLFMAGQLKRPLYFALHLLEFLSTEVIFREHTVILTREHQNQLALLVLNPSYFNPKLAADAAYVKQQELNCALQLTGLEGRWVIEYYKMDNRETSLYDRWAEMGFPPILNQNVMRQLNQLTHLEYAIYEETLTGSYDISLTLDFNEGAVILLRRKGQ